jgi:hypothetical protein
MKWSKRIDSYAAQNNTNYKKIDIPAFLTMEL